MFSRRVSGLRVLKKTADKEVAGINFKNYGSHSDNYSHLPYFTVAAAIGGKRKELEIFLKRLDDALTKIHKKELKVSDMPKEEVGSIEHTQDEESKTTE